MKKNKMNLPFQITVAQATRLVPLVEELVDVVNNVLGNPDDTAGAIVRIRNKMFNILPNDATVSMLVNLVKRGFALGALQVLNRISYSDMSNLPK